ncbi:conserved membrane hypothetical protein [Candidatus Terasakiella magnetica]|uniref:DUF1538 domain-containing protein n=1 Tax=Candidatus Terasakiella magnetica TaxID=1867952 RepID=A0A1C3RCL6_9PROT|nr:DUF1538 domain-containing protein [Candidatus Terasakiella magnetica]SCA55015.1 conserved membrane hypothetical protein [Candidatus Terasakiella magnetica]
MLEWIINISEAAISTCRDIAPIIAILLGFQFLVIRKKIPNFKKILIGFFYVLIGLTLFLVGLEQALFPLGESMATQLSDPEFLGANGDPSSLTWQDYYWVYIFAAAIGFATTVAEPSLIAVAIKAEEISGGNISAWGLRGAVAIGVAVGVSLGTFRIVTGTPLPDYIMVGYIIVIIQTFFAAKTIIPLAYDSGGVTTSTVTVPVVAALGLGLASTVPGRSPLLDGFGLIAFASVFPIMSVLAYALIAEAIAKKGKKAEGTDESSSGSEV